MSHAWRTGLVVSIDEIAAENRPHAQDPKRVGREIAAAKSLRWRPIVAQVHRAGRVCRQSFERSGLLAPVTQIGIRDGHNRTALSRTANITTGLRCAVVSQLDRQ